MTILEKIKFEEDWLSEVSLTKENIKIAFAGIKATALEQQQQPCEDCISRKAALKAFAEKCGGECGCCDYNGSGYDTAENCKLIKSMPSVAPQPKRGKWIPHIVNDKYESIDHDVCSECHTCFYGERTGDWKYCPNCGSDNREEADE